IVCADEKSFDCQVSAPDIADSLIIKTGQTYNFEDLILTLSEFGYSRSDFTDEPLQFSARGDIVDIWAASSEAPVRILFEYDKIEIIKTFDPQSQLSKTFLPDIKILSINSQNNTASIKDYFSADSLLFFDYPLSQEQKTAFENFEVLINDPLNPKAQFQNYKSFTGFQGNADYFAKSIKEFDAAGYAVKLFCANSGERERIIEILSAQRHNFKNVEIILAPLSLGFCFEEEKTIYISSREMFYKRKHISFPKVKGGRRLEGIYELSKGDYAVHERYGIGRYLGLKTVLSEGKMSEFLCLEYAKGDKLYIAPDNINSVKKYIGVEGVRPQLYSMDTSAWDRIKSRAREAAKEFAEKLLHLYAQRSLVRREPIKEDAVWERELADSFEYEETPDQMKAVSDIKNDFARAFPMERLVCGDVGYGKTEVAVRAAFKIVCAGKQTAVLSPTTILAHQHFETFKDRLSPFPTRIEVLSRFQTPREKTRIIRDLKDGKIDIIIGTHALLQEKIEFKNLGLLIIDEEHRFGVKQKEKIKNLKKNIDILMMSATPIPRTLSSALSGFRDLSVIETPPLGRLPIETHLSQYDSNLVKQIIEAELSRNGQVFYVYNKIETMFNKAEEIKKLLPDIKLGIIHGQMKGDDIENMMWKFIHLEYDILLATTIIESGLDIPTVNTMIIEDAQNFGLSQLYQLRGRIGRNVQKAYCYMFYDNKNLTEGAVKRLEAMREFNQLGSGFRLAMKDLEIRGAGAILSANQHGFVRDIGYDMFVNLLEEEGSKIKEEADIPQEKERSAAINLKVSALLPSQYIPDENLRVLFYRKIAQASNLETIKTVKEEIVDRFGKMPKEAELLFEIAQIKLQAEKLNIESLDESETHIAVRFYKDADFSKFDFQKLIKSAISSIEFMQGRDFGFRLKKPLSDGKSNIFDFVKEALFQIRNCSI
ncbi:MAG: transcription-repair coupling factor, partial [Elusimicrobiota bacterium]|nr:transcription-repair coupling factor [Elusimicrobiota bacterium]